MDYRINNEAIVGCVIARVVARCPYEVPFVTGMVNLLMSPRLRKKALKTDASNIKELSAIFGQIDGDLLGVIMNSMTLLLEGGCLRKESEKLQITETGTQLCQDMTDGESGMLNTILKDIDGILFKYDSIAMKRLYEQMWIAL